MDPTTCYQTILGYIETHDYSEARAYALTLQNWLSNRGFYPDGYVPACVDAILTQILKPACSPDAIRTLFRSLACFDFDAGQEIASLKQAIDEGWTEIQPDEKILVATHLGTCLICRMEHD